ncbi:hypothetical protein BP5796_04911 [Coleophoma crateriformis]|uniref:J domain-containing protein n=1 Tax=Coleophoma crateriformis TaxID=565419 RepID=A0A3D8SAW1_9HELO|nr:hypothetical protein BP5796_04911 [Coleophoma crateriformis]
MALTLPPDPYKALGVLKDAKLPEIRSAHRKLVLKCHPDKVQDAALKAVKQDEFQKVQQAYELLSDETRRAQYDEQVKLFELRKEMGRGVPTPRSNPFEYEVRNAEPRTSTSKPKPSTTYTSPPAPSAKVYERPSTRSYEDLYDEPKRPSARASKSQEYERSRTSAREEEKRRERKEADERERERERERDRARYEKELKKAEKEKKKSKEREKERDKERKRSTDEKHSARVTAAFVVEESSDDAYYTTPKRSADKKTKQKLDEELREGLRAENARKEEVTKRTQKMNEAKDYAAQYMQAAKQKVKPMEEYERIPLPRAQTFAGPSPSYNIRYASPSAQYSDDETPRRANTRSSSRKPEPLSASRSRETKPSKESKRAPAARDPYIVEPPSPPPVKKPSLQSHNSAPPVIPSRREPTRSKTMQPQYVREKGAMPAPPPRASTFTAGDRGRSSHLRKTHNISSDDSDSDSPVYTSKVRSPSPPRHRHAPEPTRYIIDNGRTVPVGPPSRTHRAELRDETYDARDRSESPRASRHASTEHSRPPLTRSGGGSGSRQAPRSSSHAHAYYPPDPPKQTVIPERPKMPARESQGSYRGSPGKLSTATFPADVKYQQSYGPEHVVYTPHVPEQYRRGSEPTHRSGYDSYPTVRGDRVSLYA